MTDYLKLTVKELRKLATEKDIKDRSNMKRAELIAALSGQKDLSLSENDIYEVYRQLKDREINPAGTFDSAGRFFAEHAELINVRKPSRKWPYSQMIAARTLKYVKAVVDKYQPKSLEELLKII